MFKNKDILKKKLFLKRKSLVFGRSREKGENLLAEMGIKHQLCAILPGE